ncbi:MAG: hypothetical protein ACHQXA_11235, partial [Gemmatimonadales bacterium]
MSRRTGLLLALVALGAAIGCTELIGPLRPAGYAFAAFIRDSVTDSVVVDGKLYPKDTVTADSVFFHWPSTSLPVRIWADTALGLRDRVVRGIGLWKQILQYGEYEATLVNDSASADVIVLSGTAPPAAPHRIAMYSMAPQCFGETDFDISHPDHKKVMLPVRIYIDNKFPVDQDSTQSCLDLTTAHELGHSLGLFQHSPNPTDLMFANPVVAGPSGADAATVLFLYHIRPGLVPSSLQPAQYPFTLRVVDTADVDTTINGVHYPIGTVVTDTTWFHWSPADLPVRVWVDSAAAFELPQHVQDAITLWRQALRYGQYQAALVSDSTTADVIVLSGAPPAVSAHTTR